MLVRAMTATWHTGLMRLRWARKGGDARHTYRITTWRGDTIYYCWDALGAYPPRGMSLRMPIGQFLREFEPIEDE